MSKKRKIEETNEITWFQIEIDKIKLEIDYENSTVKKVKLEECFNIYSMSSGLFEIYLIIIVADL